MKKAITRLFLFILAAIFIVEGSALVAARYWRLSQGDIESFYTLLLNALRVSNVTMFIAGGFLVVGAILLAASTRRPADISRPIKVRGKAGVLHIHTEAVRDFVDQALRELDQYSSMSRFKTTVHAKGRRIYINVRATSNGLIPIRAEIERLEGVLKKHVSEVFGIICLKINFHVKDVNINTKRKKPMPLEGPALSRELKEDDPMLEEGFAGDAEAEPPADEREGIEEEMAEMASSLDSDRQEKMPWER